MRQALKNFIIAFDFDGTIVEDEYPAIGKLREDIVATIRYMHSIGCIITIWTCREDDDKAAAIRVLNDNNVPFDLINENPLYLKEIFGNDCRKIFADIYVDDRDPRGVPKQSEIMSAFFVQYAKKIADSKPVDIILK